MNKCEQADASNWQAACRQLCSALKPPLRAPTPWSTLVCLWKGLSSQCGAQQGLKVMGFVCRSPHDLRFPPSTGAIREGKAGGVSLVNILAFNFWKYIKFLLCPVHCYPQVYQKRISLRPYSAPSNSAETAQGAQTLCGRAEQRHTLSCTQHMQMHSSCFLRKRA